MQGNSNVGAFTTVGPEGTDKSPQEIRAYWSPARKKAAFPAHRYGTAADMSDLPDAGNAAPATEPKQADLSQMPFITGGKLFFTLDGVDYVASGNIFMRNNLLLTAAHCVQDDVTGHLAENFVFERCFTGEESTEDFTFKTVALKEFWHEEKDNRWDYAIAVLNESSTVETPLRYTKDSPLGKNITAMGYPLNYFDGAQMMYTSGPVTQRLDNWTLIGGKLGEGASGGAWVLDDGVTAVGLNSFSTKTAKGGVYMGSPKLDDDFEKLYNYVLTLI